jgi:hypothetical protein
MTTIRKLGERSAIWRKAPVMAAVVGPQKFTADSALRIEREKNAVGFLGFVDDAQR